MNLLTCGRLKGETMKKVPVLIAMDGVHIDNLIDKRTRLMSYEGGNTRMYIPVLLL